MTSCCLTVLVLLLASGTARGAALGEACSADADCEDDPAVCDNMVCLVKVTESCADAAADKCVSNAECINDPPVCTCKAPYVTADTDHCGPPEQKVTGSCEDSKPCEDSNAECTESTCSCKTGFVTNTVDLTCMIELGGNCTGNSDKCAPTTTCDATRTCRLKEAESCADDKSTKCMAGAECKESTCSCIETLATATNNLCVPKEGVVGGSCTDNCDDEGAECTGADGSKTCTCKDGVLPNPETLQCGAAAMTVSIVLMVLAACVTKLTIRH